VMRPTALSSLGRLVMASRRLFGWARRTYQLHYRDFPQSQATVVGYFSLMTVFLLR
jgi:hypothetical protein